MRCASGIPDTGDAEMSKLMHEMRVRIMTSPAFTGARVLGAILFENTMDGLVDGTPVPGFLRERGIVPFLKVSDKAEAEAILRTEILKRLETLRDGQQVMLKLTIPTEPDFYRELTRHEKVARVLALSGGCPRPEACRLLSANHRMIASFSRALLDGVQHSISAQEFDAALGTAIAEIYQASAKDVQSEAIRLHATSPT